MIYMLLLKDGLVSKIVQLQTDTQKEKKTDLSSFASNKKT